MDTPSFTPEFKERSPYTFAGAVLMHRPGKIRDRGTGNQSYRASGLTLFTTAIPLRNTVSPLTCGKGVICISMKNYCPTYLRQARNIPT